MNIDWLKSLLVSRKFWLALLAVITAAVMFAGGDITAAELVNAIVALTGLLIGGIAVEDAARNINLSKEFFKE